MGKYLASFKGRSIPVALRPYFQRDSDGTDISRSGILTTKGTNPLTWDTDTSAYDQPCYDGGDGLILEAAATNLFVNSVFAGGVSGSPGTTPTSWTAAAATGTRTMSPCRDFSGLTEMRLSCVAQRMIAFQQFAVSANSTYTVSVLAYFESTLTFVETLNASSLPAGASVSARRVDGVAVNTSGGDVVSVGAHFMEMVIAVGVTAGNAGIRIGVGNSSNVTGAVAFWRPQAELGSFATSYIPTTTAAVTRAASYIGNIPLDELGLVEKTNDYSFHLGVKVPHSSAIGSDDVLLSLHDATDAEYVNVAFSATAGRVILDKASSLGNYTLNLSGLTFAAGDILNIRGTINSTEMRLYVGASSANSVTQGTDTNAKNGFSADIAEAVLGTNAALSTSAGAHGSVIGATFYDYALTAAELEALSADAFDIQDRMIRSPIRSVIRPVIRPVIIP